MNQLCMDAFTNEKFGFTREQAHIITDVLLTSNLFGIESTVCNAWPATTRASSAA